MTAEPITAERLWPDYATRADLAAIESVPLQARGLPETTYALPAVVEAALLAHPEVTATIAVGRSDAYASERDGNHRARRGRP